MTTTKGTSVGNQDNSPILPAELASGGEDHAKVRVSFDTAAVADGAHDADGDAILLCRVPSNARIISIKVFNDDLDAGTDSAVNVGLYNAEQAFVSGGTAYAADALIDEDAYATAITTFRTANTSGTELAFEARNINAIEQKVFEDAGLTEDPGVDFVIGFTQTATVTTDAAGDVTCIVEYALP